MQNCNEVKSAVNAVEKNGSVTSSPVNKDGGGGKATSGKPTGGFKKGAK